jgi:hypothetical protein
MRKLFASGLFLFAAGAFADPYDFVEAFTLKSVELEGNRATITLEHTESIKRVSWIKVDLTKHFPKEGAIVTIFGPDSKKIEVRY